MFPQSESTDYTIKGKQPLTVKGPRLNGTKEHKVSKTPLYSKDSRLSVKVVPIQPKLKVSLQMPAEPLIQGEIQSLDLHLENVGNAPMTSLYLSHRSPGLFSFGANDHKSPDLFAFPLVKEELESHLDIVPVPMEQNLEPGGALKKKLWICAPCNGSDQAPSVQDLYFSYCLPTDKISSDKKPLIRLTKLSICLKVLPGINIKASQVKPCLYDDDQSQGLLVEMNNMQSNRAFVKQISMICQHDPRVLSGVLSANEHAQIQQGETMVMGLMTHQTKTFENHHGLEFSSLAGQDQEIKLNSFPYINFIKGTDF